MVATPRPRPVTAPAMPGSHKRCGARADPDPRVSKPIAAKRIALESNLCSNDGMRWNGQQVGDHGVGAAQTLPGSRRAPAHGPHAGVRGHGVPRGRGASRRSTACPARRRCRSGGRSTRTAAARTPASTASRAPPGCCSPTARTRPIAELRVGDVVLGTEQVDGRPPLRAHARCWRTGPPASPPTACGSPAAPSCVASGDHRFLTARGWRHVSGGWCRAGRRPRLRPGSPSARARTVRPDRPAAQARTGRVPPRLPVRPRARRRARPSERRRGGARSLPLSEAGLELEALGRAAPLSSTRAAVRARSAASRLPRRQARCGTGRG